MSMFESSHIIGAIPTHQGVVTKATGGSHYCLLCERECGGEEEERNEDREAGRERGREGGREGG